MTVPSTKSPPSSHPSSGATFDQPNLPVLITSAELMVQASRRSAERATKHLLIVPSAGSGAHCVDFETVAVEVGSVVHVQPGQVHRFRPDQRYQADVIVVDGSVCPDGLFAPWRAAPSLALGPIDSVARAVTADLVAEQRRPDRNDDIMVAAAGLLLHHLARITSNAGGTRSHLVDAFLAELEDRFAQTRNVADFADTLGTSTKTLARQTTNALGLTPKDVIDRRVALEAKRCLAIDDTAIAEIGESLGFSEATNFTKFFVRMTGTTPHDFRDQLA